VLVQSDRVEKAGKVALGAFDAEADVARVALADERARPKTDGGADARPTITSRPECKGDEVTGPCAVMRSLGVATPPRALDTTTGDEAIAYEDTPADELAMRARLGQLQRQKYTSRDNRKKRVTYAHDARIHWEGRDDSPLVFDRYDGGEAIGPHPEEPRAYVDAKYDGGLDRALEEIGELFPELERARWLVDVGMLKEARWAVRDVSLEFRRLYKLPVPRSTPHQLPDKRMIPLIDNRRQKRATWGYIENEYRWPVPERAKARDEMLARQREIISNKRDIVKPLVAALKEVGDYYMVRRYTRDYRLGRGSERLSQLFPRAFPDLVLPMAEYYGVNPYMVWALMTVESSFNPDSVSTAAALGLLQVIPRTGLKTAALLEEEDFGHYDLLDEDVAVKHGTFYIGRVVRKFHGQELLAFAGYNGGPHRVAEWLDQRGDQPLDEFIEEIPYNQAREYSKKVTRYIGLYMRLYEDEGRLYIGQKLRRDYKAQPNF
jgi:soluble lytic murein transglycosylase